MEAENFLLSETFSPDDYVINIIKRAISNSQNILIDSVRSGRITVLSKDGEYFSDVDDMETFCNLPASAFKITVLSDEKIKDFKTGFGRNIDELMWQAGFYASNGRLMDGCCWDDVIELCYWPNFTRIPTTKNSMRLAALLTRHPTSIEYTLRLLKVDRSEAYQFYSAARCAGFARALNRTPEEPSLKPHRNQALLGLLLEKISGI